jgi:hypothetical protein
MIATTPATHGQGLIHDRNKFTKRAAVPLRSRLVRVFISSTFRDFIQERSEFHVPDTFGRVRLAGRMRFLEHSPNKSRFPLHVRLSLTSWRCSRVEMLFQTA